MERGELIYPDDKRIVEELLSFRKIGDKLEASSGKHDDIVMALAFAVAVANQ